MKKLIVLWAVVSIFLVFGCGPRGVSRETLNALSSAKTAAEAAEAKAKELEEERIKIEKEVAERETTVKNLEQEIETLRKEKGIEGTEEGGE